MVAHDAQDGEARAARRAPECAGSRAALTRAAPGPRTGRGGGCRSAGRSAACERSGSASRGACTGTGRRVRARGDAYLPDSGSAALTELPAGQFAAATTVPQARALSGLDAVTVRPCRGRPARLVLSRRVRCPPPDPGVRSATMSPDPGSRRHAGRRRHRCAALPCGHLLDPGRQPRRRRLLRPVRLPDHGTAGRRARLAAARIRLGAFYLRRARRLLPGAGAGAALRRGRPGGCCSSPRRRPCAATRWRRSSTSPTGVSPSPARATSRRSTPRRRCCTPGRWRWRSSSTCSGRSSSSLLLRRGTQRVALGARPGRRSRSSATLIQSLAGVWTDRLYYGTDTRAIPLLLGAALGAWFVRRRPGRSRCARTSVVAADRRARGRGRHALDASAAVHGQSTCLYRGRLPAARRAGRRRHRLGGARPVRRPRAGALEPSRCATSGRSPTASISGTGRSFCC